MSGASAEDALGIYDDIESPHQHVKLHNSLRFFLNLFNGIAIGSRYGSSECEIGCAARFDVYRA
jgi:hypothetical protein